MPARLPVELIAVILEHLAKPIFNLTVEDSDVTQFTEHFWPAEADLARALRVSRAFYVSRLPLCERLWRDDSGSPLSFVRLRTSPCLCSTTRWCN